MNDTVEDVRNALLEENIDGLQSALERLVPVPEARWTLSTSLANDFKAFVRIRVSPQVRMQAAASSTEAPAEHDGGVAPVSNVIDAFALRSQSMGGRAVGPWRAFSFAGRRDYGERHGVHYFKPCG